MTKSKRHHQNTKSKYQNTSFARVLRPEKQVRLHLCWKNHINSVLRLNIQCVNRSEFKCDATKLLEKHNADIRRTTGECERTRTGFALTKS